MEVESTSETSVNFYRTTRRNNPMTAMFILASVKTCNLARLLKVNSVEMDYDKLEWTWKETVIYLLMHKVQSCSQMTRHGPQRHTLERSPYECQGNSVEQRILSEDVNESNEEARIVKMETIWRHPWRQGKEVLSIWRKHWRNSQKRHKKQTGFESIEVE